MSDNNGFEERFSTFATELIMAQKERVKMDEKSILKSKLLLITGMIIAVCFGSFILGKCIEMAVQRYQNGYATIDVKGLSEQIVKSDYGSVHIRFSCKDSDTKKLLEKRMLGKKRILDFLEKHKISKSEIKDIELYSHPEYQQQTFESNDCIKVSSSDVEKIKSLYDAQDELLDISKEGIFVSVNQYYKVTDFASIKSKLLKEASHNALISAQTIIDNKFKNALKLAHISQGEISISAPEGLNNYDESPYVIKKFRLVVSARYKYKE